MDGKDDAQYESWLTEGVRSPTEHKVRSVGTSSSPLPLPAPYP